MFSVKTVRCYLEKKMKFLKNDSLNQSLIQYSMEAAIWSMLCVTFAHWTGGQNES